MAISESFWPIHCKNCNSDHYKIGPCDRQGNGGGASVPAKPEPTQPILPAGEERVETRQG